MEQALSIPYRCRSYLNEACCFGSLYTPQTTSFIFRVFGRGRWRDWSSPWTTLPLLVQQDHSCRRLSVAKRPLQVLLCWHWQGKRFVYGVSRVFDVYLHRKIRLQTVEQSSKDASRRSSFARVSMIDGCSCSFVVCMSFISPLLASCLVSRVLTPGDQLGRVSLNAITICDGSGATGLGLFPSAAMFNHACTPNCQAWWRGSKVRAALFSLSHHCRNICCRSPTRLSCGIMYFHVWLFLPPPRRLFC